MASSSKALSIIEEECKHCTPCKTKDKKIDSQYYCTDCEAYYCEECFDPHPRVPYLAKHIVLKHDDIDVWSKVQYKCTTHDKNLEFFCREHKMLCCHVCVSLKHRSCVDMEYVMESSKNVCSNGGVGEMLQRTCKELEEIDLLENKFESKTLKNEQSKSEYIRELKDKMKNLSEILDMMETKAIDIMTERFEANKKYSDKMCRKLKAFKAQLDDLKNQLTTATAEKECLIYICLKRGENTLDHIQKEMSDMDVNTYKENFKPKFDERVEHYLRGVELIASLEDEQTRLEEVSSEACEILEVSSAIAEKETDLLGEPIHNVGYTPYYQNQTRKQFSLQRHFAGKSTPGRNLNVNVEDLAEETKANTASGIQRDWEYTSLKPQAFFENDESEVESEMKQDTSYKYGCRILELDDELCHEEQDGYVGTTQSYFQEKDKGVKSNIGKSVNWNWYYEEKRKITRTDEPETMLTIEDSSKCHKNKKRFNEGLKNRK